MKKDFYLMTGFAALALSAFLGGSLWYRKSQRTEAETQAIALRERLAASESVSVGPSNARIDITEFLDPECEACRAMHPILKKVLKDYDQQILYRVRYMPLHGNSVYAASLLEAARRQGKFWEALEAMFDRQPEWGDHHQPRPELLPKILAGAGLDLAQLERDAKLPEIQAHIERDHADGRALGVRGTPTIFVNGVPLMELGEAPLRNAIEQAK